MADTTLMDKLVSLCKRRGFVFQSSEIYGGLGSVWDYGPLGVELKKNVKDRWWRAMVHARDDIEGLDAAILMHPRVWEASGHVAGFTDPLVDCRTCKARFRADKVAGRAVPAEAEQAPRRALDLRPHRAPDVQPDVQDLHGAGRGTGRGGLPAAGDGAGDLRQLPERAERARGRRFPSASPRSARRSATRSRPGTSSSGPASSSRWRCSSSSSRAPTASGSSAGGNGGWSGTTSIGLKPARLRWHQHGPGELAHYAKAAFDIEYEFPFGWKEIEGIHNRSDFDLGRHQEYSGKKLEYFDQAANERYLPYIVETSAGADRVTLTTLVDAYREEEVEGETRVVLGFHPGGRPDQGGGPARWSRRTGCRRWPSDSTTT